MRNPASSKAAPAKPLRPARPDYPHQPCPASHYAADAVLCDLDTSSYAALSDEAVMS